MKTRRKLVQRRFSEAAPHYGRMARLQREVAYQLVAGMGDMRGVLTLDVGAGDGNLTAALEQVGARVVALDVAWGMLQSGCAACPQALWVQADACELPFRSQSFELVSSSSAYQWFADLKGALAEARRVLKPDGELVMAMFGERTLAEFFTSLAAAAASLGRQLPPITRLAPAARVRRALKAAGFRDIELSVERRQTEFASVTALLVWLKGIGANSLAERFYWSKGLLAATEKEYRARFARGHQLAATFEVLWIRAVR